MDQKGRLITCDKCNKNTVFLKYLGDVGLSNLAGPGTREMYEDTPKTWIYDTKFGYLCPSCAKEFTKFLKEFFGEEKYAKLPPAWQIEEDT